jgi:signal transduction histidine kinase
MKTVRGEISASRRHTDKSLDAERAVTDVANNGTPNTRRILDDLIETDRLKADQRLLRFRRATDKTLERERAASSATGSSVASERRTADAETTTERLETDALVGRERQRGDVALAAERRGHEADHAQMQARREETNFQLIDERNRADAAVAALGDSRESLARVEGEQGHDRDVLSMVTHDLRSPLSVIIANADYICESTQESAVREAAEDMTRVAGRMERLLSDLLDVARIDAGTLRLIRRPQNMEALMNDVVHEYKPLFAARGMTLTGTYRIIEPIVASVDHDRIVQVLSNLLGNAMKFIGPKGTVDVDVERLSDEIVFRVRDDGPGISPDELPHVFKRFWKIDRDARRGLGLGLHICESVVNAHGGRIWVVSEVGKGTTFLFSLPTTPAAFVATEFESHVHSHDGNNGSEPPPRNNNPPY